MAWSGSNPDGESSHEDVNLDRIWLGIEDGAESDQELVLIIRPPPVYRTNIQADNKRRFRGPELDVGIWSALDDNLQEKIIAKLPFRSLFQASSLSKRWKQKFGSASFQSEVHSSDTAASWETYSPLLVEDEKGAVVGYESSTESWYQLPTHSYLPKRLPKDGRLDSRELHWHLWAADGPLFCWTGSDEKWRPYNIFRNDSLVRFPSDVSADHILVANPLTETWKQLPPLPEVIYPSFVHVVCEERKAYKVLLGLLKVAAFGSPDPGKVTTRVQIFDSNDGSWTVESYLVGGTASKAKFGCSAIINGVLYMLVHFWNPASASCPEELKFKLISLDLKERHFTETPLLDQNFDEKSEPYLSQLLVCGSHLMLVMRALPPMMWLRAQMAPDSSDDEDLNLGSLWVFRIDFERLKAVGVSRAPRNMVSEDLTVATCNGKCICIGREFPYSSSICYNVKTREWFYFNSAPDMVRRGTGIFKSASDWRWRSITYQPGLAPFFKV